MAWIESHQEVVHHPKTRKLALRLGIQKHAAVGLLHCLWHWAVAYAHDGDLTSYTDEDIALGSEWEDDPKTFVDVLVECGWIDRDGEVVTLHDWDEYAGRLIDRRKANAERKRMSRARPADIPESSEGVTGLPNLTRPNQTEPDLTKPRERARAAINEEWKPTPTLIEWAANEYPSVDLVVETEKFRDHFRANGKPMKNWEAAWKNWIRRCQEFGAAVAR